MEYDLGVYSPRALADTSIGRGPPAIWSEEWLAGAEDHFNDFFSQVGIITGDGAANRIPQLLSPTPRARFCLHYVYASTEGCTAREGSGG